MIDTNGNATQMASNTNDARDAKDRRASESAYNRELKRENALLREADRLMAQANDIRRRREQRAAAPRPKNNKKRNQKKSRKWKEKKRGRRGATGSTAVSTTCLQDNPALCFSGVRKHEIDTCFEAERHHEGHGDGRRGRGSGRSFVWGDGGSCDPSLGPGGSGLVLNVSSRFFFPFSVFFFREKKKDYHGLTGGVCAVLWGGGRLFLVFFFPFLGFFFSKKTKN